ncbi:LacI family DNA-binding transcriptional regulator [Cellulomonas bogoriensis]|uniref:LacI family transcriptional regulator n=1 Tax=Cellulomonas bogoriensis 69B4 = DSM 16987 TaxID=1386082 RepID=A0A0A0BYD7_9CELL|nr:LacI family DNA-binding transcriptional regulator [Cellulomonas bogoriensis]KGM12941.1 LacI family transcriptional regulator [Cellulomonas bogoriensis 69B4 = DSM 16987]
MSTLPSRPTLLDLARAASVSRATAARVMAGESTVRADLAQRVHAAAEQLGYRTNQAARALRRGRAGAVALVAAPGNDMDGLLGPFVGTPLQAASKSLLRAGLLPVLLFDDGSQIEPLVRHLSSAHVDAAIVILQGETELIFRHLEEVPIPLVFIGNPTGELDDGRVYVACDAYGGSRQATRAMLTAGRRRIAHIAGPSYYLPATRRAEGFRDELAEWGLAPGPTVRGNFDLPSGAAAMAQILRRSPDLDGVFAASDLMAVGALRVLEAAGRRVPDDVSVVGFDDTVVAATASPPLTTVRQPFAEMGVQAASLVIEMLEGDTTAGAPVMLPTTLTLRESV